MIGFRNIFSACFISTLLVFGASCKSEMPAIPSDVLPPEKMIPILTDMRIADVVAENVAQGSGNEKELTAKYYNRIYLNHKVTQEQFNTSYKFYLDNPVWLDKLYAEILNELAKKQIDVSK